MSTENTTALKNFVMPVAVKYGTMSIFCSAQKQGAVQTKTATLYDSSNPKSIIPMIALILFWISGIAKSAVVCKKTAVHFLGLTIATQYYYQLFTYTYCLVFCYKNHKRDIAIVTNYFGSVRNMLIGVISKSEKIKKKRLYIFRNIRLLWSYAVGYCDWG